MSEIFIVDDDPSISLALSTMLRAAGYDIASFLEGGSFLDAARARTPGCVLIDVHLPDCSGLDLLKAIDAKRYPAPVFVISGRGDIATAVDAVRNGALDFIEKPFDPSTVVERVREAIRVWQSPSSDDGAIARNFPGHERLTSRERDVLERIARGASNKEIGRELGISPRTVEVHRARVMEKLSAKNAADLMCIVFGRGGGRRSTAHAVRPNAA